MTSRVLALAAFAFVTATSASAMCGGGGAMDMGATKAKPAGGMQCGMKMDGMDMGEKKSPDAKSADPHAGMDMGEAKGDAKKAGGCGCCGSGGEGKSGGMCGKQAAATVDGGNDPLLKDPMWDKSTKPPQSHAPAAP
jgi:hypothetical protein